MSRALPTVPLDCRGCGRCCFDPRPRYLPVFGVDLDRMTERTQERFVVIDEDRRYMALHEGHCAALQRDGAFWICSIYEERPDVCRALVRGSSGCVEKLS